ncbi:MAG: pyridoxal 5'-phosphate synthase glutaminase subunit PdxT [Chloroflexi bacterium]|nr:pyridoxal 5'-phosphate synthase glutaminase subunit PdxT [Chloroflexota bacterium]
MTARTTKARVGVLALQGDFREHLEVLRALGATGSLVRRPEHLDLIDALVIPGGESTTIGKLAFQYGIIPKLRERAASGMPVWGTCAGAIFIARRVPGHPHPIADLMDVTVVRNAFGRQQESFELDLAIPSLGAVPFPGVFIRSPTITALGPNVVAMSSLPDGTVIAAREGRLLATSFHPELTRDLRFHEYFLGIPRD